MERNLFTNFTYSLINSSYNGYQEVLVSFNFNNKTYRRYVFIKTKKGLNYINEAKKIIEKDIKNETLLKKATYINAGRTHRNSLLKAAAICSSVAALTFAGLFTWKYLTSNPGGGDVPAEKVTVGLSLDAKDAIEIDKDEAIIGKEFTAKITVKEEGLQIIGLTIKSGDNDLKETDDYDLTPITSNEKLSYTLKIHAASVVGIIQILNVNLSPIGEDWKIITFDKAIEIVKNCMSQKENNEKQLAHLLRSKGSQGELTVSIEGDDSESEDIVEFDLRSEDKAIDKDVYVKHKHINLEKKEWESNYAVYLPNTKNDNITNTGIYFFFADSKSPIPFANEEERAACTEAQIEQELGNYASQVFGYQTLSCLLEGGQEGLSIFSSLVCLSDDEKHPYINENSEFKSKDDQSLICSFEGSYDFEPLLNDTPQMRLNIKVKDAKISDFICNEANIEVTATTEESQQVLMSASMSIKLDYKTITNEYDPEWEIK